MKEQLLFEDSDTKDYKAVNQSTEVGGAFE